MHLDIMFAGTRASVYDVCMWFSDTQGDKHAFPNDRARGVIAVLPNTPTVRVDGLALHMAFGENEAVDFRWTESVAHLAVRR